MAIDWRILNRVAQTAASGYGGADSAFILSAGAIPGGYAPIPATMDSQVLFYYARYPGADQYEIGSGLYTHAGRSLARSDGDIIQSSAGGSRVAFSGVPTVVIDWTGELFHRADTLLAISTDGTPAGARDALGLGDDYLTALIDDPAPVSGGDLSVGGANNYRVTFTDASDVEQGSIGYAPAYGGIGFAYSPDGLFDESDGGVLLNAGKAAIYGSQTKITSLIHSDPNGYMDVRATETGILYTVPSPASSWDQADTGTDSLDIPSGEPGAWVEISGLGITLAQDVDIADVVRVDTTVYVTENSGNRGGSIRLGVGVEGSEPSGVGSDTKVISGGFSGGVAVGWTTATHGGLTTGETITIWAQMVTQDHNQFDPQVDGNAGTHELIVSVAGSSGGAASVNLGTTLQATTVTVTNTGGTDAILPAATQSEPGILTPADKIIIDGIIQEPWVNGSTVAWNVNTRQAITAPGTYPLTNGQTIRCTPSGTGTFNFTTPAITGDDTYSMDLIVSPGATSPTIQINGAAPDFVQTPMPSYETAKRYRFSLFADADETMLHWAEAE